MYKVMETNITQHIMLKEALFALSVFVYNFGVVACTTYTY